MERERIQLRHDTARSDLAGPQAGETEQVRAEAAELLAAADQVLDAIGPIDAETYLQQNRQRGGQ